MAHTSTIRRPQGSRGPLRRASRQNQPLACLRNRAPEIFLLLILIIALAGAAWIHLRFTPLPGLAYSADAPQTHPDNPHTP